MRLRRRTRWALGGLGRPRRARIAGRLGRRFTALILRPAVAAFTSIVPLVVTAGALAGVAAVAVAKAPLELRPGV
jgi:hypothetical protein